MAAIQEPEQQVLTMREAAEACGVSERTIGRKLRAGALPGAYKVSIGDGNGHTAWRIPVTDLRRAGLLADEPPTDSADVDIDLTDLDDDHEGEHENGDDRVLEIESQLLIRETVAPPNPLEPKNTLEIVGSDRFGRLRAELAEAVAAAELLLVRADIEKWRAIAEERGRSLERADFVLGTLAHARPGAAAPTIAPAAAGAPDAPTRPTPGVAEIPDHIREEARRYAQASPALRELRASRRWRKRRD